ncbi:MAG: hypothetical protein GF308_14085 [Candidatus Heimdallarchaeota archaeon]|nr:hypothetical protein [Candidatus Heimdallarchaeota archaeon]
MDEDDSPSIFGFAIRTSKCKAEQTIEQLKKQGLYDNTRLLLSEGDSLWIPIKKKIKNVQRKKLPVNPSSPSLREKFGIRAFDIIGDIIVIFIPDELEGQKFEIGSHLLNLYPHITAVYKETSHAKGKFRVQSKELIAGQGSETIHREHGLKFKLDVNQVFFSPRQVTERMKLTKQVKKGDHICVFFSGIAAIPIYLSKFTQADTIIGIELNSLAHHYAVENLRLNDVKNVQLINGDVSKVVPDLIHDKKFDLVIMPLPKNAPNFLSLAKEALVANGHLIILIVGSQSKIDNKLAQLKTAGFSIQKVEKERPIAPKEWRYTIYAKRNSSQF